MIERSVERSAAARTPEQASLPRKRGICAGCGSTTKALIAPRRRVGHGYTGPMHCLSCCPRFSGGGLAMIERMDG